MIKDTASQDVMLTKAKPKKLALKVVLFSIIAVTISITAYPTINSWSSSDLSVNPARVRIAQVERGEFIRDVSLQGNIVAANSPKLYAPAVGTVTLISNPGALVNKGDLIAVVSSPELTNRLMQEQSKLESLDIELQRQKIASKQK
jgi:HlyD family secretion protein